MADGTTALMIASQNGHIEVVRALLDKEAKTNGRMIGGTTALLVGGICATEVISSVTIPIGGGAGSRP